MKKFKLIILIFVLNCSGNSALVVEVCGESNTTLSNLDYDNNPNYVFEIDETFVPINLVNSSGNVITVNSYLECQNYVEGGWKKTNTYNNQNFSIVYFLYTVFLLLIGYFMGLDLKKRNLSSKNIFNYLPFFFIILVTNPLFFKLFKRGLYFPLFSYESTIKYISLFLIFIFYYLLSKQIKNLLNLSSSSLSIVYFLSSYFLIDFLLLPITKFFTFNTMFIFITLIWFAVLIYKNRQILEFIKLSLSFLGMLSFNRYYINLFQNTQNYKILNSDVTEQWFPLGKQLYENNLYFALDNNFVQGYGYYLTYIQSVIQKLNFLENEYVFSTLNSNVLIIFIVLLVNDLRLTRLNKILLLLSVIISVLDDGWLRFLIFDSLMLEGILSFAIATFVLNLNEQFLENSFRLNKFLYILFFSSLIFSKQFIETLVLLFFIYFFIFSKKRIFAIFGILVHIIGLTYNRYLFMNQRSVEYIDQSLLRTIFDVLTLNNGVWKNSNEIYNNLIQYPFLSLMIVLVLILFFYNFFLTKKTLEQNLVGVIFIYLNLIFVFVLYIFIWQDIEVESSLRYVINTFFLIYIAFFSEAEKFQENNFRNKN